MISKRGRPDFVVGDNIIPQCNNCNPAKSRESKGHAMVTRVVLATAILVFSGAHAHSETSVHRTEQRDGVPYNSYTSDSHGGRVDLELDELWRVGGDAEDGVLFGVITKALIDDENNVYLLDGQLSQVQVFSPNGEHLGTLGGPGTGPGELTEPGDMVFMPDGTIGLVQIFPGKVVNLNRDGTPAGEFHPNMGKGAQGFLALVNGRTSNQNIVLSGISISGTATGQQRKYFVRRFAPDGELLNDYFSKNVEWDFSSHFTFRELDNDFVWWRMDVSPAGYLVACEERYEYSLSIYHPDGYLERVIQRAYESYERKLQESMLQSQIRQFPPGTEYAIEEKEQDVCDLIVKPDDTIWVLTSRAMYTPEPGAFATFEVFGLDGAFLNRVRVLCSGNAGRDRLIFAGDDLVFQVVGFWDAVRSASGASFDDDGSDSAPMEVVCYKVRSSRIRDKSDGAAN
jgi:hypothetical protein